MTQTETVRRSAARTATLVAVPLALAVLLVSVLAYGGFGGANSPAPQATGPVAMTTRELSADADGVCQAVIAHLPDQVLNHARRPVTDGAEQNAAYGDPPVTVQCATPMPDIPSTSTELLIVHNGVCWRAVSAQDSTAWTTVDRTVPVTVTVPGPNEGSGDTAAAFSDIVRDNDPVRAAADIPSGCTG